MLYGWRVFFEMLGKQLRKRHGAGRPPLLQAIYVAACGQYLVDHQHRCPGRFPWHGQLARLIAHFQCSPAGSGGSRRD